MQLFKCTYNHGGWCHTLINLNNCYELYLMACSDIVSTSIPRKPRSISRLGLTKNHAFTLPPTNWGQAPAPLCGAGGASACAGGMEWG